MNNPSDEKLKQKFDRQRKLVLEHDKDAVIAETSARAFIDEITEQLNRLEMEKGEGIKVDDPTRDAR